MDASGNRHRLLLAVVGLLVLAVLAGAVALWPSDRPADPATTGQEDPTRFVPATLTSVRTVPCQEAEPGLPGSTCIKVRARPDGGDEVEFDTTDPTGDTFRAGIDVATLDPFHGYKNAIDDQLDDAVAVLDAFHVVKLGTDAVDQVRRRVQQQIHGHRGRKGDPLYGIRTILRCGRERLTDKQKARLTRAIAADERHDEVHVAWHAA